MCRIIDTVLFLSQQGLPFRGHREQQGRGSSDLNEGNFLELLKLLSKYDSILADHLAFSKRNETYLSHQIQDELIRALADQLLSKIKDQLVVAKYFAVIVDSTIDISRVDQFSFTLRMLCHSSRRSHGTLYNI